MSHHAPVPKQKTKQDTKQDLKFFSKYDDGIFVMKYMEIWDPCVNMMVQFSSSNINDIRIQYVGSMVFSQHNSCHHGKATINNHKAMVTITFTCLFSCPLFSFSSCVIYIYIYYFFTIIPLCLFLFPGGVEGKSRSSISKLYDFLVSLGFFF